MKLKKMRIVNYRNLSDISIDFSNFTILIGKNDVGKSNILKALDLFFRGFSSKEIDEIATSSGGYNDFEYTRYLRDYRIFVNQKPAIIDIIGTVELSDAEVKEIIPEFPEHNILIDGGAPHFKAEFGNEIEVHIQVVGKQGKEATFKINTILMNGFALCSYAGQKQLRRFEEGKYGYSGGEKAESVAIKFLKIFRKTFLTIPAVRNIVEEGTSENIAYPDGRFVPNAYFRYEKDASLGKVDAFEIIQESTTRLIPKYKQVTAKQYGEQKRDIYFGSFSSSSVGTGINQQFNIVFQLDSHEDAIFAIEEPEIHLHPDAQRKVFNYLKEKSKNKQIIITTHSTIFTECSGDIKLYLITNEGNVSKTKLINGREEFKSVKYELGARNTDLFFYNKVILIEGETEEVAIPIICDALGYDLFKLGIKLINIKGKDKLGKIEEFLKCIKDSDVASFVIMDKNKEVEEHIQDLIRANLLKKENCAVWINGDFEDCFSEEQVVKAMKNIHGDVFDITSEQLKQLRASGKSTSSILKSILHDKNLGDLNKPTLGEALALIIKSEIEEAEKNKQERQATEPERIVERFCNIT